MAAPAACRDCGHALVRDAKKCAKCGALRPADHDWKGDGFEWASRHAWIGRPLVHVAFGCDTKGRARTARGIVAIGQRAVGGVAVGIVAIGFVSVGIVACGLCSLGIVSVALGCAVGVNAVAPYAVGVTAIGLIAHGVAAIGWKS